jgi:hypothetical protein
MARIIGTRSAPGAPPPGDVTSGARALRTGLSCPGGVKVAVPDGAALGRASRLARLAGLMRPLGLISALLAALLAVVSLSACGSLSLVYGQAGTLSYWWLDRYVDFTPEQAPRVRAALQEALAWHRRAALAEDIAWLDQIAGQLAQDLGAAQLCGWLDQLEQRGKLSLARLLPPAADIAATLDARQLKRIAERRASKNEEWRDEHLQAKPADRIEADAKRMRERAEMLYGRLDSAQRRFILERLQGNTPWVAERWYADMLVNQAALFAALRKLSESGASPANAEQLAAALLRPGADADAATLAWREQLQAYQCSFAADLHKRTTPAQREAAARTLRGWAQDLRAYLPAAAAPP